MSDHDRLAALLAKMGVRRVNMEPTTGRFGKIVSREAFAEMLAAEGVTLTGAGREEVPPAGFTYVMHRVCTRCSKPEGFDRGYFCEGHGEPALTAKEPVPRSGVLTPYEQALRAALDADGRERALREAAVAARDALHVLLNVDRHDLRDLRPCQTCQNGLRAIAELNAALGAAPAPEEWKA